MALTQTTFSPAMRRRVRQEAAEIASLDDDIDQLNRLVETEALETQCTSPPGREKWASRKTFLFIVATSLFGWLLILAPFLLLN